MATRMQQRRGTAAQWTSADPILAAGEIGFETDTSQFKIGDGTNHWSDLSYFKNLEDLGGTLDDYIPLTQKDAANGVATLDSSGYIPVSQLGNLIGDAPSILNTLGEIADVLNDSSTAVNSRIDTAMTASSTALTNALNDAIGDEVTARENAIATAISDEVTARNTAIANSATTTLATAAQDATDKADAAELAATTTAQGALDTHASDTTNVHGISDTSALVTLTGTQTLTGKTISAEDNTVTINAADITDVTASASELNILDGATLTVTELNYVDGVTSAIQTQLDAKAPLANPTFTGTLAAADISITGDLTVGGTTTTVNAQDLVVTDPLIYIGEGNDANIVDLGLVSSFNDGAYQHAGIVRDATDGIWKLFSSVEDEPTTTVNFSQAVYDTLKVGGIEYSDGVQVKQGVPSLTAINQQTSAYTTVLTDRDKLVEVSSASGVTVTIPANSTVAYPVGTSIDILQTGSGQVTIAGAGGVTVNATPGLKLRTQWSSATLFKRATDTWVVFGDLSA
jgi:hypothetical protein